MKASFLKLVLCLLPAVGLDLGHAGTIVSIRSGNWFTDTNNDTVAWGGIVPSASDNVIITNNVSFNGASQGQYGVENLDIGAGGSLNFNSGELQMNGANSVWTGGSVGYGGSAASGPLLQAGTLTISSANDFLLAGLGFNGVDVILINSGTIFHTNTGSLAVTGAHVQNLANATYDLQSDAGIYFDVGNGADFDNSGLFRKSGGSGVSLINIDFNNTNGSVSAQSGTLTFVRSFSFINGALSIGSGASVIVANNSGIITNGIFSITSGGALDLTAAGSWPPMTGLFTGSGSGFFELSGGILSAQTPCTFAFPSGFFHWTGGTLTTSGNTLTNTGEMDVDGTNIDTLPDFSTLVNQGRVVQNSLGALSMNFAATFNNLSGAVYDLQSDSGIDSGNGNQNMNFNNGGLLSKSAGTGQSVIAVPFNNLGGTVGVGSGTLTLAGGGASANGIYNIGTATKLAVASGSVDNATFNVASGGLADLTGGASGPKYSGLVTGTGAGIIEVNNGRLLARGCTLSFPTNLFLWTGGTIDVTGSTLTNVGLMTVNTASNSILDGTFPGGMLVNQGTFVEVNTGNFGLGRLTHFTNTTAGIYDLQSDGGISDNSGGNNGFALDNVGLFRKSGGTNVSSIGVPFNSFGGTIEVDSGQLSLTAGGSINSGTFKINAGAVLDITGGSIPTYTGTVTGSGAGTVLLTSGTLLARSCTFSFPTNLFLWAGGTIDVTDSTLTNHDFMTASTTSSNLLDIGVFGVSGLLVNLGQFVQTNVGDLSLGRYIRFTNTSAGLYNLQSDAGISDGSGGSGGNAVDNAGLFRKSGGTNVSSIGVPFNSYGGTIEVDNGRLNLAGGGTINTGAFKINAGAVLDITGGSTPTYTGTVTGSGAGTVLLNNGIVDARVPCNFNFPASLFQWTGGTIDVTGNSFTNLGFITVNTTSNSILDGTFPGGTLVNEGTFVEVNTGNFGLGRLTHFTNTTAGLYDLQSDGGISDNSGGNSGFAVDNVGLFRKSGGTNTSSIGVPFNSFGGTIEVDTGRLNLAAGGTIHNGTFNITAAGAVLDITGGSTPTYTGTVGGSGAGTVLLANGIVDARVPCNFNFPSNLFQWVGGKIDVTGNSFTNLGFITVNTISNCILDGTFPGGVLANQGTFGQVNTGNFGLGRLTHFTNTTTGVYDLQSDAGISDNSGGNGGNAVDNAGLFRKSSGTNVSSIGVPFNSYGGTIEVDSGTLALTTGNYDQNGGGLTVRLSGRGAGQFGVLAVTGTATLSGTLSATLRGGFAPSAGDRFQILSCSSLTGTFANVNLPAGISVNYSSNTVTLIVTNPVPAQLINPRLAGGNFTFNVVSVLGQGYTVQTNSDLSTTNWAFYTNLVGNGSSEQVIAPIDSLPKLFFRVRQP